MTVWCAFCQRDRGAWVAMNCAGEHEREPRTGTIFYRYECAYCLSECITNCPPRTELPSRAQLVEPERTP